MFKKIKTYSNWCDIDQFEGKKIKNRTKFDVLFKDGTVFEAVRIRIQRTSKRVMDMGHYETIPIEKAWFDIEIFGQKVPIRATNVKVRKV